MLHTENKPIFNVVWEMDNGRILDSGPPVFVPIVPQGTVIKMWGGKSFKVVGLELDFDLSQAVVRLERLGD